MTGTCEVCTRPIGYEYSIMCRNCDTLNCEDCAKLGDFDADGEYDEGRFRDLSVLRKCTACPLYEAAA